MTLSSPRIQSNLHVTSLFISAYDVRHLEQGITNDSFKLTNVLVNHNGEACIADYGTVELVLSTCVGTQRYWSPEARKVGFSTET